MSTSQRERDDLMLPAQLAEEWQLRPRTLEQWRYRRMGPPYIKVGGRVRYSRKACAKWAAQHSVTPEDGAA